MVPINVMNVSSDYDSIESQRVSREVAFSEMPEVPLVPEVKK